MAALKKQKQNGASRESEAPPKSFKGFITSISAAILSGLLFSVCFAPAGFFLAGWIAMVPFLWSLKRATPVGAALRGYLFGMAYLASLLWWISVVRYPAGIGYFIGCLVLPFLFIPWSVVANRLLARDRNSQAAVWACAALWVMFEWFISQGMFAFPWWCLGNTQARNLLVAQSASIGGIYIISFCLLMVNFCILAAIEKHTVRFKPTIIATGVIMALVIAYGAFSLTRNPANGDPISIAIIQPSFSQEAKESSDYSKFLDTHIQMSVEASEYNPDIILWSESVTHFANLAGDSTTESTQRFLENIDVPMLVAGVYEFKDLDSYNSVVAVHREKGFLGSYRKMQLVPFGEMMPFREDVRKINPALGKWLDEAAYEFDMSAGKELFIFDTPFGRFGAPICFESIMPGINRRMTLGGAQYLFIITNDAWFLKTAGVDQHAALGAMRAIETGRYVVQAANSGISFVAGPYGRFTTYSTPMEKTVVRGTIYKRDNITTYTKYGDWFCKLSLIIFIIFGVMAFRSGRKHSAE